MTTMESETATDATGSEARARSVSESISPDQVTINRNKLDPDDPDRNRTTILYTEGISSVQGGIFNYANTYVGAGIIGIPLALYRCGFWLGMIFVALTAIYTVKTSDWLVISGFKTRKQNYDTLMEKLFGKVGLYTYFLFTFLYAYGADVAYIIIMSTNVTAVVNGAGITDEKYDAPPDSVRRCVVAVMALIVLPIALFREMHSLRHTSFFSIVAFIVVMAVVIIYSPIVAKDAANNGFNEDISFAQNKHRLRIFAGPPKLIFVGLAQIIFAYIGQHACFEVLKSLEKPSLGNWLKVSFGAVAIAYVLFTSLGASGYLSFGENVEANVLETFPDDDVLVSVARVFFAIAMIFSYPMNQFMARLCIDRAIFVKGMGQADYPTTFRHLVETFFIWGSITTIVMFTDDLAFVLSLTGAVSGSTIGYILPPLAYFVAFRANFKSAWQTDKWQVVKDCFLPATCLAFGSIALVVGTVTTFTSS